MVTRPLQTGTWRLQSGGAGWRGPRHSVPPLHALTRGRRAPSAARGAFTLPWAPATRGREGGVRGLRSSSYLGTQERNLVPRKTTLESQPEAGGRPPSRRRRARLPLLAGGAPKWGPRGASSASLCAFCPLSLKTSACEGVNGCGVTFPAGPGDRAPDRGRRRRGRRPLPGIGASAATPRSWRWGMWAEGSARAEPASPPWSPGRAAAPGGAQDLWGQQPPLPLSQPGHRPAARPGPSRAHALRAACPGKAPRHLARASHRRTHRQL